MQLADHTSVMQTSGYGGRLGPTRGAGGGDPRRSGDRPQHAIPGGQAVQGPGCTVPVTAPSEIPPAVAEIVTVSPSARNVLVVPSGSASGRLPPQVSSSSEPSRSGSSPDTVPDA